MIFDGYFDWVVYMGYNAQSKYGLMGVIFGAYRFPGFSGAYFFPGETL